MKQRLVLFTLAALIVAATVSAQPAPPRAGGIPPQAMLAKYLQLTTEQVTAWQQIGKDTAGAIEPLAANAKDLQKQLDTALEAATPDPLTVGKLAISLRSVREQIRATEDAAKAKRVALLTPDQKLKYDAFQAALAFLRQHDRGPGPAANMLRRGR